jgi:hypothetical protein
MRFLTLQQMRALAVAGALLGVSLLIASCGGTKPIQSGPSTQTGKLNVVIVSPTSLSLNPGDVAQITAIGQDASANTLSNLLFTWTSDNPSVTVDTNGNVCAGTWDSKFIVCTPASPNLPAGCSGTACKIYKITANVTATPTTVTGVTGTTAVNIHNKISSIALNTVPKTVNVNNSCLSQSDTLTLTTTVFDTFGTDITQYVTIGPVNYTSQNVGVATIALDATTKVPTVTAVQPGTTKVIASTGNNVSLPVDVTVCPPQSITITDSTDNTITAYNSTATIAKSVTAVVKDTLGITLTNVPLSFYSTNGISTSVTNASGSAIGSVVVNAPGGASLVAACIPPTCNTGPNQPVYSNVVTSSFTGTSSATTTLYITGPNAAQILPVDTSTGTVGTAIAIPTINSIQPKINSYVGSTDGQFVYMGTDQGELTIQTSNKTVLTTLTGLKGKVLALSPDNSKLIMSDTANSRVLTFDTTNGSEQLFNLSNVTRAVFSPDSSKAYLLADKTLYIYSRYTALRTIPNFTASMVDVAFAAPGTYGYIAGGSVKAITPYATCKNNVDNSNSADVPPITTNLANTPNILKTSMDGTHLFGIDSTNLYDVAITNVNSNCSPNGTISGAALVPTETTSVTATPLGQGGSFVPSALLVSGDIYNTNTTPALTTYPSVYALGNLPGKIVVYKSGPAPTVSTLTFTGGGVPTAATLSNDGALIYFVENVCASGTSPTCAGSTVVSSTLHIMKTADGTDTKVTLNLTDASTTPVPVTANFIYALPK